MSIDEIMELPHHEKCKALYKHLLELAGHIEKVYQRIGQDDNLFQFQAEGIEALLSLELCSINIHNDASRMLKCEEINQVDDNGEEYIDYTYYDEKGNEVTDVPHQIGSYLQRR